MSLRLAIGALLVALTGTLAVAEPDRDTPGIDASARHLLEQTLLSRLKQANDSRQATILALEAFRRVNEPSLSSTQLALRTLSEQLERTRGELVAAKYPLVDPLPLSSQTEPVVLSTTDLVQRASIDRVFRSLAQAGISCCLCSSAATCDDGVFCNGAEACGTDNICAAGLPPCVDGDTCTSDVCLEDTQSCTFDPLPPPDEVASLAVGRDGVTPAGATLSWSPVADADAYNVYRGAMTDLGDMGCFAPTVPTTTVDDGSTPSELFLYLVSSVGCGESGLGDDSFGARPLPPPCP